MNAVEIQDLCFAYDSREVLHNVTLAIPEGSFTVFVGPNGGGKTTLLRLILGLLEPSYGEITVLGHTPVEARSHLGYVPQSLQFDAQFPITVREVVLMGRVERHWFGRYSKEDCAIAEQALTEVNLAGYGVRAFSDLSGGERQRVLIAQALATEPRILLLDEPTANLDPQNREQLYRLLHQLNHRLTIMLVSHNLSIVTAFATHVVCVNRSVDMHLMAEVGAQDATEGAWTRIAHRNCPVGEDECVFKDTPHHGHPHQSSPASPSRW
ncbi:MAG: ABC transporter ATP-binding protein [Victivallales bacterium]|nr:ABC transporter ATP-binding protein [Victivallales bacterium]